jgi:LysR family nitrogen assimilation transcriptional regulator
MASLEHHFQAKLFNRSSRGVTLTHEGRMLMEYARTILRQVDRATSEIRNMKEGVGGEVILALPSASALMLASKIVRRVSKEYPEIKLSITESMSGQTADTISKGHADLALVPNGHLLRDVEAETVLIETLHFGGLETDDLKGMDDIDFKDVCRYPLILPIKPNFVRGTLDQAAFDHGLELNIVAEQTSSRLLQGLLADGIGYSVLTWPSFYMNLQRGGFCVKKVVNPEFSRPLTIAWPSRGVLSERVVTVRNLLREAIAEAHAEGIMKGELQGEASQIEASQIEASQIRLK